MTCEIILQQLETDPNFKRKVIISDEGIYGTMDKWITKIFEFRTAPTKVIFRDEAIFSWMGTWIIKIS